MFKNNLVKIDSFTVFLLIVGLVTITAPIWCGGCRQHEQEAKNQLISRLPNNADNIVFLDDHTVTFDLQIHGKRYRFFAIRCGPGLSVTKLEELE